MQIVVSPLSQFHNIIDAHAPSRIVSLLDSHAEMPNRPGYAPDRHHKVAVHDIIQDRPGQTAPAQRHVDDLLYFLSGWEREAPLFVHCWAGISRSSATALIAACLHNPDTDEHIIAQRLRAESRVASPNLRLIALADAALSRRGRLIEAVRQIGPGAMIDDWENDPFVLPADFSGL